MARRFGAQGSILLAVLGTFALVACDQQRTAEEGPPAEEEKEQRPLVTVDTDPFPSTYAPLASEPTLIRNVTILDGKGGQIDGGAVLISDGKIQAVGADVSAPDGAVIVEGTGKWLTPGIIDVHSHLGAYPSPIAPSLMDGNEATSPNTAEVWIENSIWPQDPGFNRALAGGVTTIQILPGSSNLFGGRSVIVKNVPSRSVQGMKYPGARYGLKMACGENPKRTYEKTGPASRMANFAGYRKAWIEAQGYKDSWEKYLKEREKGEDPDAPKRDLKLETLAGALAGDIIVHMHCYRAEEMLMMLDVMKEFGYKIGTFHHAVESYKIADKLAEAGVCSAMWSDWWGFKLEAYDGIRENIPFVHAAGACAIVHSDSEVGIQMLNQEAAKALSDGNRAGLNISKAEAWVWLSLNPARAIGVDATTGSLDVGKNADLVLWDGDPFSVYTRAEEVFIDGALVYDRNDPTRQPLSDFELGQPGRGSAT